MSIDDGKVFSGVALRLSTDELTIEADCGRSLASNSSVWNIRRGEPGATGFLHLVVGYHVPHGGALFVGSRYACDDLANGGISKTATGQYLVISMDLTAWQIQVQSDPSGSVPAFYQVTPARFVLGTTLGDVVRMGVTPELNPDFIANVELVGHSDSRTTFLKDVASFPPMSILRASWNANRLVVDLSEESLLNALECGPVSTAHSAIQLLRAELRHISDVCGRAETTSGPRLLLSGGVDSALLSVAAGQLEGFEAITFESPNKDETRRASTMARRSRLRHSTIALGYNDFSTWGRLIATTLSGLPAAIPAVALFAAKMSSPDPTVAYLFGEGPDELDGAYTRSLSPERRLALLEEGRKRFHGTTAHIDSAQNLYAGARSNMNSDLKILEWDLRFALVAHHLVPLWLGARAIDSLVFCPYVTGPTCQLIARDPRSNRALAGKSLIRKALKETMPGTRCSDAGQPRKVGLPDAVGGAWAELLIWSLGVAPDQEVLSAANHWPERSQANLGWWSEAIRGLRQVATSSTQRKVFSERDRDGGGSLAKGRMSMRVSPVADEESGL